MPTTDTRAALEKIERAFEMVSALCNGTRRWTMSIPADERRDPDLVICDALVAARDILAAPPLSAAGEEAVILSPGELIDDMPELGALSTFRGHPTRWDGEGWRYVDTGELIYGTWESRPCGHCLRYPTPEGHDPCLGTLPGVRNACCGHGHRESAYVQFDNGVELRGFAAPVAFVGPVAGRAEVLKSARTYSQDIPDSAAAGSAERDAIAKELFDMWQDEVEEEKGGSTRWRRQLWTNISAAGREAWGKDADRILAALRGGEK